MEGRGLYPKKHFKLSILTKLAAEDYLGREVS